MKRALGLVIIIGIVIAGLLSVRGTMPFMAILGSSMEPAYKTGDLITIQKVSPSDVKVGDIVVFTVPPLVREAYNYPEVVVHRVVKAYTTETGTTFRTRGDNVSGEDPFTVRSQDIRGQPGRRIAYLGFPLLFLQSRHGLIFTSVCLCLFALYLYNNELSRVRTRIHSSLFAPIIEENRRTSWLLENRVETTEKAMTSTDEALKKFASAIELYAEHLNSHTSAIQGLSQASQELKQSAAEQNKVLARLLKVREQLAPGREEKTRVKAQKITGEAEDSYIEKMPIAEQQARYLLRRVEDLEAVLEDKTTGFVSEVRREAEASARQIMASAEDQVQSILSKALKDADEINVQAEMELLTLLINMINDSLIRYKSPQLSSLLDLKRANERHNINSG